MEKNKKNSIDPKKADAMVRLYQASGGKHPKGELTKSVWFDLEKLKRIIQDIERTSTAADIPGLRFYFGTYIESEPHTTINNKPVDYIFRNTLIMVPTKQTIENGVIINKDYDVSRFLDPENQGELCPEECGGTGLGG
ncbi:MAG: hypothetical protein ACO1NS_02405 [Daejeonella sp.]